MNQRRICMDSRDWKYGLLSNHRFDLWEKRGELSCPVSSGSPLCLKAKPPVNSELANMKFHPQATDSQHITPDNWRMLTCLDPIKLQLRPLDLDNKPVTFIVYKKPEVETTVVKPAKKMRRPSSVYLAIAETNSSSEEEAATPKGRPAFHRGHKFDAKKFNTSMNITNRGKGLTTDAVTGDGFEKDNISSLEKGFTNKMIIQNDDNGKRHRRATGKLYVPPHLRTDLNQNTVVVEEVNQNTAVEVDSKMHKQSAQERLERLKNEFVKPPAFKRVY